MAVQAENRLFSPDVNATAPHGSRPRIASVANRQRRGPFQLQHEERVIVQPNERDEMTPIWWHSRMVAFTNSTTDDVIELRGNTVPFIGEQVRVRPDDRRVDQNRTFAGDGGRADARSCCFARTAREVRDANLNHEVSLIREPWQFHLSSA
jgi:hypothetical protein